MEWINQYVNEAIITMGIWHKKLNILKIKKCNYKKGNFICILYSLKISEISDEGR